jgi:hypothetical protein
MINTGTDRLASVVVWVDPDDIEYVTRYCEGLDFGPDQIGVGAFDKFRRTGAVEGGEWDRLTIEFSQLPVYRGLDERINEGRPWEETTYFDIYTDRIERGDEPWGCTSEADLRSKCEYIESLWRRIEREGYRSQQNLGKYPVDEINVNVGRDGDLLFNDGRHRLAAAKLLGVDEVPVRLLVVHEGFEEELPPK